MGIVDATFPLYLSNISTLRIGTSAVFVLIALVWFYVLALIVLAGAVVNELRFERLRYRRAGTVDVPAPRAATAPPAAPSPIPAAPARAGRSDGGASETAESSAIARSTSGFARAVIGPAGRSLRSECRLQVQTPPADTAVEPDPALHRASSRLILGIHADPPLHSPPSAAILGCLLTAPVAFAADGEDTKLNLGRRRRTGRHERSANSGGSIVRTIVGLAVVLGVIYGLHWVLKQVKASKDDHRDAGDGARDDRAR